MKTILNKNTLIGIAFVASLVMIYFGINYLKGMNVLKKKNTYTAIFNDVTMLTVSSPVYINGYRIGIVNAIDMISDNPIQFAVKINLEEDFRMTSGSRMEFGLDLFNNSIVKLLLNANSTSYLQPGDTIYGSKEENMMDRAMKMLPGVDSILVNVDSITVALHKLMSNPAWEHAIGGIDGTITELNASSQNLTAILAELKTSLPPITQNLNDVTGDLKNISSEINSLDIAKTFATVDQTLVNLKNLSEKLGDENSSIGKLMNDTQLHDSLTTTLNMAAKLLEDFKKDPKRYLSVKVRLF
ncbi:MAG: MlaD family protein [Dysgonamonadaceae bacterium]|jgi:phospholipid/cholesterol/gamma-HCH transport system substrate-binding protein|nr:MlaD family protein [Dysgonamonadaceae bacterium]